MAVAFLLWLAAGAVSVCFGRRQDDRSPSGPRPGTAVASWALLAAGCVAAVFAGASALGGQPVDLSLGDLGTGFGRTSLRLDELGGLFAVISFGVAVPACLAGLVRPDRSADRLPAALALGLAATLTVLGADHVFVFLFGWEALTLAFFVLTGYDRGRTEAPRAAVSAATFGKASGAALAVGLLLAARDAGGFGFDAIRGTSTGETSVATALVLLGFAIKVGIVPVQVWLPPAYSAAAGPARALMAGTMVNVGFYGMWRTIDLFGGPARWVAVVVLVVAGATALLGIAHAAVHPDVRGLVAWSSVENAGLITAAFGTALVGSVADDRRLMAAGLLAATAQVVTHSLGKSLLFVSVDRLERDGAPTDLDHLRGVARTSSWAAAGLVIGAMTLAGLPLTAGFASEWLILESLMQQFRVEDLALQLASATAAALVALTIGVAGVTFVRLVALTAFGPNRGGHRVRDRGVVLPVGLLALGCLGVAALAPLELTMISRGLDPLVGSVTDQAHAPDRFAIQPVFAEFSSLSPTWLWIVLPAMTAVVLAAASAASRGGLWRVRRVPAWSSASPGTDRGMGYTSFAYAHPMRRVLANILLTRHQMEEVQEAERTDAVRLTAAAGPGRDEHADRRAEQANPSAEAGPTYLAEYQVDVVEVVDRYVYAPGYRALLVAARATTRLQSGRLDAYVAYMLVALLAVLAVVVWLA